MIRNYKDNIIIKNGDSIFKSQAVDSFIEINSYYSHQMTFGYSGVSTNYPIKAFLQIPTGFNKATISTNTSYTFTLPQTSESSYKKFYFFGNLDAVYDLRFNHYGYSSTYYRGNIIKLMELFPYLNRFEIQSSSQFNQNLTNTVFPEKLETFQIYSDSTLSGNVNTIKNFDNIEDFTLRSCPLTGNFTDINFTNLRRIFFDTLNSLRGSFNDLIDNNPNFTYLYINNCNLFSGNSTTLNVQQLTYLVMYLQTNSNFIGSITNWNFNTGLTYFQLQNRYLTGDITNWDFSDTKITIFYLRDYNATNNKINGNLSNWTLPSTLSTMEISYVSGLTALPDSLNSASSLNSISVYYCNGLTSISGITIPNSLRTYQIFNCANLADDINNITFSNYLTSIYLTNNKLYGDIGSFVMPTGVTSLQLNSNINIVGNIDELLLNNTLQSLILNNTGIGGDISGLTLNNTIVQIYFYFTNIGGNIVGWTLPNSLSTIYGYNSKLYIDFDLGEFHTNKLTNLRINNISGITGNLSNFIIDNNITYLYLHSTNINSDLSKLNIEKVYDFYAYSCGSIYGDLTNWLTGTTILRQLRIQSNLLLSGDTSSWSVNSTNNLYLYDTNLSGALKHNNIYEILAYNTNISSNINTDFNFSNRAYTVQLYNTEITGTLSGVTLYSEILYFYVHNCPNIIGSNHFIDYIFEYRKYFTQSTVYFNISNIGDSVTGSTETMGDLGTYTQFSGSSTYYYWNLTENEINYLADGLDYTGTGTNIPWNSKQKIYWIKNAKISSVNLARRYVNYSITY